MFAKAKMYFLTILGAAISALALNLFLIPADIAPGGMSGLAVVVNHITGIPVGGLILILNYFYMGTEKFQPFIYA